jgi:hypothetical protein
MNVDRLIKRYFTDGDLHPMIEVFDHDTIYTDCESQFNEEFCGEDDLDNLW